MERDVMVGVEHATTPRGGPEPGCDPSVYCPVCSKRLEARKCKLLCSQCGYYLSCSDYY